MTTIDMVNAAMRAGYRVVVHDKFFPFESHDPRSPGLVHAVVDDGAQAIFCSREWYEKARKVLT